MGDLDSDTITLVERCGWWSDRLEARPSRRLLGCQAIPARRIVQPFLELHARAIAREQRPSEQRSLIRHSRRKYHGVKFACASTSPL